MSVHSGACDGVFAAPNSLRHAIVLDVGFGEPVTLDNVKIFGMIAGVLSALGMVIAERSG